MHIDRDERDATLQELGTDLVGLLSGLVRGLGLYEAHNANIGRLLDGLLTLTERTGAECLELRLLHDEFFINGLLLRVNANLYARASELAQALGRLGVGSIEFGAELSHEDLERLAEHLVAGMRGAGFDPGDLGAIRVGPPTGTSVAALRFHPDRLALYTLAGLAEAVDRLRGELAEGRPTSLLAVRRMIRLVVEGTERDPGPWLAIATSRVPGVPMSTSRRDVLRVVLAVGFASALGVDRRTRASLGLGAAIASSFQPLSADEALSRLLHLGGAGSHGLSLAVAVHDAIRVQAGHSGGLGGQILALTRLWVDRTATGPAPLPIATCVARVLDGQELLVDVELDRSFARWLGRWPVGSVVALADGGRAVVVDPGDGARPPRVARVRDGTVGAPEALDPAAAPTPVSPDTEGLDLGTLGAG